MRQSTSPRNLEIDRVFDEWAAKNGFSVQVTEHWDVISRRVAVIDMEGDVYEIYASQNHDEALKGTDELGKLGALAGAGLVKHGASKHLAFRREREKFTFRRACTLNQLSRCLDEAHERVRNWISQAGHGLSPRQ